MVDECSVHLLLNVDMTKQVVVYLLHSRVLFTSTTVMCSRILETFH